MSRFELGQYLITLGGDVDMTKVGRQLMQSRERGAQRTEPATGRRGQVMSMLDQISAYRSVVGSKMGDPVPMQQLPMTMDDTVPPLMVLQFRPGFFKRPLPPLPQFKIDKQPPKPLAKPMPQQLRTPSLAASSV